MSDAPRTDAMRNQYGHHFPNWMADQFYELARSLERELAEARAETERLAVAIQAATVLIAAKGRHNTMLAYNGLRTAIAAVDAESEKGQTS